MTNLNVIEKQDASTDVAQENHCSSASKPQNNLPIQDASIDVLQEKYCYREEKSHDDIRTRVSVAVSQVEDNPNDHIPVFTEALLNGFIPAGRILSAAGTDMSSTWINCFVEPVGDCLTGLDKQGNPGIYRALEEAGLTMQKGGGVGYDFSLIRPNGALVRSTMSKASGPVSYMTIFDASCQTLKSAGGRRGAQMAALAITHPDVKEFIQEKRKDGALRNFNVSVGITDEFMEAVEQDLDWKLYHEAEPHPEVQAEKDIQFDSDLGAYVYETVKAADLYNLIMKSNYDFAEPGFLLIDRINKENNLNYIETIRTTNPCGEQPLPPYACCDLGSINLTKCVEDPFTSKSRFDMKAFVKLVPPAVRFLDNVLDSTPWPLEQQREEAMNKRRIGLGFSGVGSMFLMLGIKYGSKESVDLISNIAETMMVTAYRSSIELAKEKGPFPLLDAEKYLQSGFAQRLPQDIKDGIREHGIRNSHLLSIAPTGTISLAWGDNISNGIEPCFSYSYTRKKLNDKGEHDVFTIEDHAYRLYKHLGHDVNDLPDYFISAQDMTVQDHVSIMQAVQPFIDTSISKTVNIPEDYDFEDFKQVYMNGWKSGLKGLATFRPNHHLGQVLIAEKPAENKEAAVQDFDMSDPDRRIVINDVPELALESLRWKRRPPSPNGSAAMIYTVDHPDGNFAVFVSHVENGKAFPYEVWINGAEQPRGLGALAKSLSMDMRSEDRAWLREKLDILESVHDYPFEMHVPGKGPSKLPGVNAAVASIIRARCEELGSFDDTQETPLLDSLISKKAPKTGPDGTLSWTVDVENHNTGDEFTLGLKELTMPNGERRPYAVWLAGNYPRYLDGLLASLSMDMRVIDPAWIGKKLNQLRDFAEPLGDFMTRVPGAQKQRTFPSTIAYVAELIVHRYNMLGILDEDANPVQDLGGLALDAPLAAPEKSADTGLDIVPGKLCTSCGAHAVIKKDGCDFCTSCGEMGSCG